MIERCAACGGVIRGIVDTRVGEKVCCCDTMIITPCCGDPCDCNRDCETRRRFETDEFSQLRDRVRDAKPKYPWVLTDEDVEFLRGMHVKVDE